VQGFKTACKVGRVHDGYAHIVEQTYDDLFKVWYGRVGVACTDEEGYALATQEDVPMQLPDGRSMTVRLLQTHVRDATPAEGGAPGTGIGCYFISTTPLVNVANLFPGFME
jgi:hypothetical protein